MTVNRTWLDGLSKKSKVEALADVRRKAAELYRAQQGRDPGTNDERKAAIRLLEQATDEAQRKDFEDSSPQARADAILRPLTRGERRKLEAAEDHLWNF